MSFYNHQSALRRPGNKNKIADKIIGYFPTYFDCLISLFYGTGSLENRFVGSELIEVAMRGDSQDKLYRYDGKLLKSPGGYPVVYLLVRDGRVIGIGSK